LVGDDPLQGRALFKDTVTFIPQFKLAVCTNVLFDIKSNDDGTWRRIRIVDFVSKFVDNPSENPEDHEFKIDLKLDDKFITWVPVFTSLLVEVLFKTGGIVHDCDEVMASSQKYKEQQDYFAGFMKDRVCVHPTGLLNKGDVYSEFQEWYSEL
jgi:phage/plasmid-associated DNA primase